MVFSKFERLAQKALSYATPEGTDRRLILKSMHISTDELGKILRTLEERGEVHVEQRDRRTIVQRLIATPPAGVPPAFLDALRPDLGAMPGESHA